MSGHSKWATTKRQKGITDQKRGVIFTKLGNIISIASREGGGDPEKNFKLRLVIEKAKQANMPKENIERAIKKGTGELGGAKIEEIIYEAFGPDGVGLIIETLTDNKNRTVSNIKSILNKHGGSLSGVNSVLWMFKKYGVIRINKLEILNLEEFELKLIDLKVEDVEEEEEELVIYIKLEEFQKIKEELEKQKIKIDYAELEWVSKEKISSIADEKETKEKIKKILEELDDDLDVNNVFCQF
ncbi:YebC/PmpR family DNA-binding transcriptional regulator [Candidatus Kuenenbacteria bacterium HGW-Kuenenbacteria-1]|uniref:Probable transcriptional regulatory protein CVV26_01515 n=1 Tax=Candidatus Kuenenbacteria bacterium HGW-Kuenenbacteria-1 TaxID=2013812 RepID=A0A2N1UNK2_9BACT|nr:MAG: YebC/PmpR family DNA-binding transcriptional regulator [Candidatus Kuenenbacteria bacterium HGW-Kuenenbacteria-1]